MSALITLGDAVPEESCEIQATEERKQPEAATLAEVREATWVTATGYRRGYYGKVESLQLLMHR